MGSRSTSAGIESTMASNREKLGVAPSLGKNPSSKKKLVRMCRRPSVERMSLLWAGALPLGLAMNSFCTPSFSRGIDPRVPKIRSPRSSGLPCKPSLPPQPADNTNRRRITTPPKDNPNLIATSQAAGFGPEPFVRPAARPATAHISRARLGDQGRFLALVLATQGSLSQPILPCEPPRLVFGAAIL